MSALTSVSSTEQSVASELPFHSIGLIGREEQLQRLLAIHERSCSLPSECVVITGQAGVGKSSLLEALRVPVTQRGGIMVMGKYDPLFLGRMEPFSAISACLEDLIDMVDQRLEQGKKNTIQEALISLDVAIMSKLAGNLHRLLGPLPCTSSDTLDMMLSDTQAFTRFAMASKKVLRAIAQVVNVVFWLDDLQNADELSLQLMKRVLHDTDQTNILFLFTMRDNKNYNANICALLGAQFTEINLPNLTEHSTNVLLSKLLHTEQILTLPLAKVCFRRTLGNPFFLRQFIESLVRDDLLTLQGSRSWAFDLVRIQQETNVSDNLLTLLTSKIQHCDALVQESLKLMACLGYKVERDILDAVLVAEMKRTKLMGTQITSDAYISMIDGVLTAAIADELIEYAGDERILKFTHDLIQTSFYNLYENEELGGIHRRIGRTMADLLEQGRAGDIERLLFAATDHMNRGISQLDNDEDRIYLIRVNMKASNLAKEMFVFGAALEFLQAAKVLIASEYLWKEKYDLSLSLSSRLIEIQLCCGNIEECDLLVDDILIHGHTLQDKVTGYHARVKLLLMQKRFREARNLGIKTLRLLGVKRLTGEPSHLQLLTEVYRTSRRLKKYSDEDFACLPVGKDPMVVTKMAILGTLLLSTFHSHACGLQSILTIRMIHLSLDHGTSMYTSLALTCWGLRVAYHGAISRGQGDRFGQAALKMAEKFGDKRQRSFVSTLAYGFAMHKTLPLQGNVPAFEKSYHLGFESGDMYATATAANEYMNSKIVCGSPLDQAEMEARDLCRLMQDHNQLATLSCSLAYWQFMQCLLGMNDNPGELSGEVMMHGKVLQEAVYEGNGKAQFTIRFCQLMLAVHFGNWSDAERLVPDAMRLIKPIIAHYNYYIFQFFVCITYFERYRESKNRTYRQLARQVIAYFEYWVNSGVVYCETLLLILRAEKAAMSTDNDGIRRAYDDAVGKAKENGFPNYAGLACERFGLVCLRQGNNKTGAEYLNCAIDFYDEWKAVAKTLQIKKLMTKHCDKNITLPTIAFIANRSST